MKKLEIKINKNKNGKIGSQDKGYHQYRFIDMNMGDGTIFNTFLFGKNPDRDILYPNIWYIAKVKVDDVEFLIPYNTLRKDKSKSCLFHSYDGIEMNIMTNNEAILIATCYFLGQFLWYGSIHTTQNVNPLCELFIEQYGEERLSGLFTQLKYQIYEIEHLSDIAFDLLD